MTFFQLPAHLAPMTVSKKLFQLLGQARMIFLLRLTRRHETLLFPPTE
jgi:hypothetical protein